MQYISKQINARPRFGSGGRGFGPRRNPAIDPATGRPKWGQDEVAGVINPITGLPYAAVPERRDFGPIGMARDTSEEEARARVMEIIRQVMERARARKLAERLPMTSDSLDTTQYRAKLSSRPSFY